jgi:ribosomal protein L30E
MKLNRTTTLSVLLGALSFGAMAQSQPPLTREQVQAELREAIRTGDIIEGYSGLTRYELNPSAYPARPVVAGKTREQVNAELREAIRTGDIVDGYESRSRYERNPGAYPARPVVAGKTRDEVKAELAEAVRTGDIIYGETSMKLSERYPGTYPKAKTLAQPNDAAVHAARQTPESTGPR